MLDTIYYDNDLFGMSDKYCITENSSWTRWGNWTECDDNGTIYRSKTCIGTAKYGGEEGCEPEGKLGEDMRVCNVSQGMKRISKPNQHQAIYLYCYNSFCRKSSIIFYHLKLCSANYGI